MLKFDVKQLGFHVLLSLTVGRRQLRSARGGLLPNTGVSLLLGTSKERLQWLRLVRWVIPAVYSAIMCNHLAVATVVSTCSKSRKELFSLYLTLCSPHSLCMLSVLSASSRLAVWQFWWNIIKEYWPYMKKHTIDTIKVLKLDHDAGDTAEITLRPHHVSGFCALSVVLSWEQFS